MSRKEDIQHSILIVSASEQFDAIVKKSLKDFITVDSRRSGTPARRCTLEKDYDLVVINAPLQDESGEELAKDAAERGALVLLVVPSETYSDVVESVTDDGIMVISKPVHRGQIDKSIRYLVATRNRIITLQKKVRSVEEKMEELRVVSRAKILLIEKKHMSEDEAHKFIGKKAMDNGVSRKRIAEAIIDDLGD
ncbi:MAG: ANTAR domain-containing protein [Lachnospiraceae bacterium]|nr:ANTAR domain-containing protein [Lachnospiraceae bacterium]